MAGYDPCMNAGSDSLRRRRAPVLGAFAALVLGTGLAGCGGGGSSDGDAVRLTGDVPPGAEAGLDLVLERGCTSCHAIGGAGASAPGQDLSDTGSKGRGVDAWIAYLKDPQANGAGGGMPAVTGLTDEQYRDLAVLLAGVGVEFTATGG